MTEEITKIDVKTWHIVLLLSFVFFLTGSNGKNGFLNFIFLPHDEVAKVLRQSLKTTVTDSAKKEPKGYTEPFNSYSYLQEEYDPSKFYKNDSNLIDEIPALKFPLQPTRSDLETGGDNYIGR